MSTVQQVIDDIDALVDEQLRGGEPETGYDYGNPKFPKCRWCGRDWHGKQSPWCVGSTVQGPLRGSKVLDWDGLKRDMEQIGSVFRSFTAEINRAWESVRRAFLGTPDPPLSRCALAARRRMHSDQLRVQRRAVRRERRARQREARHDPLEVHDDHVVLTVIPDVSGFRRELRRDV